MAFIFGGILSLFNFATAAAVPRSSSVGAADAWHQVLAVGRLHRDAATGDTLQMTVLHSSGQGRIALALSYSFK